MYSIKPLASKGTPKRAPRRAIGAPTPDRLAFLPFLGDCWRMDFDSVFMKRRSVRSYEDRPVPPEVRESILAAALRAPTAGNLVLYSILEIEDPELKARLAQTCDDQPFIARAPWVLVFLADWARAYAFFRHHKVPEWCADKGEAFLRPRESDLLLAACDALIAAQTAAVAAEALGLGSCYIGDIMENGDVHRELLELPPYAFPVTMLCLGYPTEQQKSRPQTPRLSADLVVNRDRYRQFSADDFERMYAGGCYANASPTADADNPGRALYARKFSAPYCEKMRSSVRALLEEWR